MNSYLLVAASALILAVGGTPLARRVALRYGVIAMPNARNIHLNPVPMMGGAAIYVAFILVLVLFGNRYFVNQSVGIFIGATLISLMGVVDDRWGLGSYIKLAGQFAAAGILIFSGVQVQLFGSWIDVAITLLWVVGITNAMNLLDNMDGLSGGVAMIAAIFFALLAAMSKPNPRRTAGGGLGGRVCGLPDPQLEPGARLYGRHGQPLYRLRPRGDWHQAALSAEHGRHHLDDSAAGARRARL